MRMFLIIIALLFPMQLFAVEYENDLQDLINSEIKKWSQRDIVIDAISLQNNKNADLSISDIKILDSKWRGEKRKSEQPLTTRVLESDLSQYLKEIQEDGDGVYTEIIITDNKGLSVGQSVLSENYWQGENQSWLKTFGSRSYATHISDLAFNDNTGLFQVGVSFIITLNEQPMGMVYVGVDVEQLEMWKKRQEEN